MMDGSKDLKAVHSAVEILWVHSCRLTSNSKMKVCKMISLFQTRDFQVPCYLMGGVTSDPNFPMETNNNRIRWTNLRWWHLVFMVSYCRQTCRDGLSASVLYPRHDGLGKKSTMGFFGVYASVTSTYVIVAITPWHNSPSVTSFDKPSFLVPWTIKPPEICFRCILGGTHAYSMIFGVRGNYARKA